MIVELPEWQPYASGEKPWTPESTDRGRVVVALAPAPINREQWSAEIVFELLEDWSQSGHRVVLADCVLEHPMLHRKAGLANEEGLVDAALFGASVAHIARAVPGRSFFFVGTGSPTGDPEAVLSTARFGRLQDGFREAGVTFVAFIREGCVGEAALVGAADDVFVLAETGQDLPDRVREAADKVRAVVGPADTHSPPPAEALPERSESTSHLDVTAGTAEERSESDGDPSGSTEVFERAESRQQEDAPPAPPEEPAATAGPDLKTEPDLSPAEAAHNGVEDHDDPAEKPVEGWLAPVTERSSEVPSSYRPQARGKDPDLHGKLVWGAVALLIVVVLFVLGVLG